MSILKTLWSRHIETYKSLGHMGIFKLQKVYFYWICRDKQSFEWFQDLLSSFEEEGVSNFLEIRIFLTQALPIHEIHNLVINDNGKADCLTGLRSRTNYGRPNWEREFEGIKRAHSGCDVGVFYCGNKMMSTVLHRACNEYSDYSAKGVRFFYSKETIV